MPNTSITSNPGILGAHTVRTLKTEAREQPNAKGGFWDSFKNLSLGRKVGRTAATIGTGVGIGALAGGGALLGGLGLTLATGGIATVGLAIGALGFYGITRLMRSSQKDARVARQEECRPRETKCVKSEDTLPNRKNVPLTATTVLGAKDRREATAHILNQVCNEGLAQEGPASGLSNGFLPDLNRAEFSVQTSDGQISYFGRSAFQNKGKDLDRLSDNDKSEVVNIFKGSIASEPSLQNDPEKIAKWQKIASGFMNQMTPIGAQGFATQASGLQLTERRGNYMQKYNLRIEPGGQSAILECTETGGIDGVNVINGDNLEGNGWRDEDGALDYAVDRSASTLKKTTVSRITLEDENAPNDPNSAKQVRDGVGFEILSYSSSHEIGLMSQEEYDSKYAERAAKELAEKQDRYKLHLMGKAPLSEAVVLQLEKDLIPISKEYAQTIASGQSTPRDIQQMVDDCYKQLAILANDVVTDPDIEDEDRMKIAQNAMLGKRMAEQYPLSLENVLNESPLVQGVRDFDLQEFAESKAREVVAARLLGMTKESYFSAIKQDGPGLVLGKTFSQDERLHPISAELRSGLIADFNQATTLDDFYSMAQNRIQEAREKAKAELNPVLL